MQMQYERPWYGNLLKELSVTAEQASAWIETYRDHFPSELQYKTLVLRLGLGSNPQHTSFGIAQILNVPLNAVDVALWRGSQNLKAIVQIEGTKDSRSIPLWALFSYCLANRVGVSPTEVAKTCAALEKWAKAKHESLDPLLVGDLIKLNPEKLLAIRNISKPRLAFIERLLEHVGLSLQK